ncbi:short-chain dehydrogenase [Colletotrichum plurivorum]|uniref:Short-chain dehydrogenase n=1 Tax=Colletotrichum plurivorum TaxID=2175906 RepID=A0A8H6N4Z3_9PEZI|nr:short-chain dehydrogenase [Colletotrichum plurivorum]
MAPTFDSSTKASELVAHHAPHISGKTILVTGISPYSLGEAFVRTVAVGKPATFILAGRSPAKFQPLVDDLAASHPDIAVKPLALDLASLASVRSAAAAVNSWTDVPQIDILVNNVGIMAVPYALTEDGLESQFQTNHVGHFLLTNLVMPKILASAAPRVVNISSNGHRLGPVRWTDHAFDGGRTYDAWSAYGQSKTANALFSVALAERLGGGSAGLAAFSVCPGFVAATNLAAHGAADFAGFLAGLRRADERMGNKAMWLKAEDVRPKGMDEGVATHVFAAFDQGLKERNGEFLSDCRVADPYEEEVYPWARGKVEADMLWRLSEKLVGQEFSY